MKTRQMKKLHLGEFAEFILPFTAVMGDKVNDEEFGVFVTEFSQFLNANHMGFGFLTLVEEGPPMKVYGAVEPIRRPWNKDFVGLTESQQALVKTWLEGSRHITQVSLHELKDAWYGEF